ncbi:hypothetical protein ACFSTC_08750 [Nonomuraea ferruginea]
MTDAERPAGARAAASSGGDSAEDERGAKRDSEDVSQTLTFRIPGPPSVHIGRPPTAEEAAAAAAPPPASKGTTASKAQSVPEKTRSAQKAVPETEKTRSGEKSVPEAEKTRSGEKAVPEAETPSGQKAAPETEARSGTKAVAEAEGGPARARSRWAMRPSRRLRGRPPRCRTWARGRRAGDGHAAQAQVRPFGQAHGGRLRHDSVPRAAGP